MNKQLLWNEFGEFLNFVVPLLKASTISKWIENVFFKQTYRKDLESTTARQSDCLCPLCDAAPATPFRANCGHVFCYYCIQCKIMAAQHYTCPICDRRIVDITPE